MAPAFLSYSWSGSMSVILWKVHVWLPRILWSWIIGNNCLIWTIRNSPQRISPLSSISAHQSSFTNNSGCFRSDMLSLITFKPFLKLFFCSFSDISNSHDSIQWLQVRSILDNSFLAQSRHRPLILLSCRSHIPFIVFFLVFQNFLWLFSML